MNTRYDWLDTLRGIAIVLVIIGHVIGGLEYIGGGNFNLVREIIYTFHMPLMFAISGFVAKTLCCEECNKKIFVFTFIKRNFISLYIPYLIFGYLFWAIKYFLYAGNNAVTLENGLNLWWNYEAWVPGWYLLTLLAVRIVDMVMQWHKISLKYMGVFWLILYILGYFIDMYLLYEICAFGMFYFIGRVLKVYFERIDKRGFGVVVIGLLIGMGMYVTVDVYAGKLLIGTFASIILFYLFSKYNVTGYCCRTLGKDSMIPYTLHAYFTIPIRVVLDRLGCKSLLWFTVIETIVAIVLSLIVIWMMENIKIFKGCKYFFYPIKLKRTEKESCLDRDGMNV